MVNAFDVSNRCSRVVCSAWVPPGSQPGGRRQQLVSPKGFNSSAQGNALARQDTPFPLAPASPKTGRTRFVKAEIGTGILRAVRIFIG